MCSMLVLACGFRNEIDSCVVRSFHVVSAHALKNEVFRLISKKIQVMTFVLRSRFQW